MPSDYEAVRDSCINNIEREKGRSATKEERALCKRKAAIWYYKKHGTPVRHASLGLFTLNNLEPSEEGKERNPDA